jgi:hypothetical protein
MAKFRFEVYICAGGVEVEAEDRHQAAELAEEKIKELAGGAENYNVDVLEEGDNGWFYHGQW